MEGPLAATPMIVSSLGGREGSMEPEGVAVEVASEAAGHLQETLAMMWVEPMKAAGVGAECVGAGALADLFVEVGRERVPPPERRPVRKVADIG